MYNTSNDDFNEIMNKLADEYYWMEREGEYSRPDRYKAEEWTYHAARLEMRLAQLRMWLAKVEDTEDECDEYDEG